MKIIVSGASGTVGRSLVPRLAAAGADLVLAGRDPAKLRDIFPELDACGYADLLEKGMGADLFVHLATLNSTSEDQGEEAFRKANVDLTIRLAGLGREMRVKRFLFASSVHALYEERSTNYARSKREANRLLKSTFGPYALTAYLAAVKGATWSGRMSFLRHLPTAAANAAFAVAAAIKPTLTIDHLADFILNRAVDLPDDEVVLSDGQADNIVYKTVRRGIDLIFAVLVAGFFWWLLAIVWLAVKLDSKGPGIFAQDRVGQWGKVFTCFKFRTMRSGTIQAATNLVSSGSVTKVGHFLRRSKLDELPQIWNIFRDEISLIGPRPCLPSQTELVAARTALGVLALKPGISGLAQINDVDMSDPQRLAKWDARYAGLQCLSLDLHIILATALGSGRGDRVAGSSPSASP